jgi:hypothetical protein
MERFLPRLAGEVATPDLIRGSRRGQMMLAPSTRRRMVPLPRVAGVVVCANFDGFAVTHWPEDPALQPLSRMLSQDLLTPSLGGKWGQCSLMLDSLISMSTLSRIAYSQSLAQSTRIGVKTSPINWRQRGHISPKYLGCLVLPILLRQPRHL